MVCSGRAYYFKVFKGCLPQILLGPLLNTLTHMCVKLSEPKRWGPAKNHNMSNYQIAVNVSQTHKTYYTAYKCVCKKDYNVIQSQNHPDLQEVHSPKTKNCIKDYKQPCWNGEACRQVIYLYQKLKHCRKLQNQYPRRKNNLLKERNMLKKLLSANLQKPCKISSPQLGKWRKLPLISRDSKNTEWKSYLKPYRNCALKKHVLIAGTAVPLKSFKETIWSQLSFLWPWEKS